MIAYIRRLLATRRRDLSQAVIDDLRRENVRLHFRALTAERKLEEEAHKRSDIVSRGNRTRASKRRQAALAMMQEG